MHCNCKEFSIWHENDKHFHFLLLTSKLLLLDFSVPIQKENLAKIDDCLLDFKEKERTDFGTDKNAFNLGKNFVTV